MLIEFGASVQHTEYPTYQTGLFPPALHTLCHLVLNILLHFYSHVLPNRSPILCDCNLRFLSVWQISIPSYLLRQKINPALFLRAISFECICICHTPTHLLLFAIGSLLLQCHPEKDLFDMVLVLLLSQYLLLRAFLCVNYLLFQFLCNAVVAIPKPPTLSNELLCKQIFYYPLTQYLRQWRVQVSNYLLSYLLSLRFQINCGGFNAPPNANTRYVSCNCGRSPLTFRQVSIVLYLKPHASNVANPSGSNGTVTQMKHTAFLSASSFIGSCLISSFDIVTYFLAAP